MVLKVFFYDSGILRRHFSCKYFLFNKVEICNKNEIYLMNCNNSNLFVEK